MKKWSNFLGVDVSKNTLDIHANEHNKHLKIENNSTGFSTLLKWAKELDIDLKNTLFVMEHTGGYEYKFIQFLQAKDLDCIRIPGLEIKKSMGITRGKSDKIDAKRIATYADEKQKKLTPEKPLNTAIIMLRDLLAYRKKVVRENAGYKTMLKERKHKHPDLKNDFISKDLETKIKNNQNNIEKIEKELETFIKQDEALQINYNLLTSIKGIGQQNALMTIAFTENFTAFPNARAYAVYVGVVPFEHSSGTSLKGRKRISHIANRELKSELNQAARSAIIWNKDMKEYAERILPHKPYPVVLNNIKFKLILRMFAVVKKQEKYVDKIEIAA